MPPPSNRTHPAVSDPLDQLEALLPSQVQTPEKTAFLHTSTRGHSAGPHAALGEGPALSLYGHHTAWRAAERHRGRAVVADSLGAL